MKGLGLLGVLIGSLLVASVSVAVVRSGDDGAVAASSRTTTAGQATTTAGQATTTAQPGAATTAGPSSSSSIASTSTSVRLPRSRPPSNTGGSTISSGTDEPTGDAAVTPRGPNLADSGGGSGLLPAVGVLLTGFAIRRRRR